MFNIVPGTEKDIIVIIQNSGSQTLGASDSPGRFVKAGYSVGRIGISNKFPDNADVAGSEIILSGA